MQDVIVAVTSPITLRGDCALGDAVQIAVASGQPTNATVSGMRWELANVTLKSGFNRVVVTRNGIDQVFGVTVATIVATAAQPVFIRWHAGVDNQLKTIAAETLSTPLSQSEQDAFVANIKARTEELIRSAYKGVADVIIVASQGPGTHTVNMRPAATGGYGNFPFVETDCMDRNTSDESDIFVGTFAEEMKNLFDWVPMQLGDEPALRAEDVAQALSRTAVHEIGHSLGLVGSSGDCIWMLGNPGGHPFGKYPADLERSGAAGVPFLMAGFLTPYQRMGYPNVQRMPSRLPFLFCEFDRSYMTQLLP